MSRLLDPKFKYRPACSTDVRRTFRKERERLRLEAARSNVKPIIKAKRAA